jgi:ribosome modulation factor
VLIRAGIPGQTDEMIPYIKNRSRDGLCPFEKMLSDTDSPEEAYRILKKTLNEIQ